MKKNNLKLALIVLLLAYASGCADLDAIIIKDQADKKPGRASNNPIDTKVVKITTEPEGAKINLISMGNRQMQTYYSPAEISYFLTPAIPAVVNISQRGYKPKNVRLDGTQTELHVILEKATLMQPSEYEGGGFGGAGGLGGGAMGPGNVPGLSPMDKGKE